MANGQNERKLERNAKTARFYLGLWLKEKDGEGCASSRGGTGSREKAEWLNPCFAPHPQGVGGPTLPLQE